MTAFFYLHFRYVAIGRVPDLANVAMSMATVGVYLQAVAVLVTMLHERSGKLLKIVAVVITNTFFALCMSSAFDAGWPAPSQAIEIVLILLLLMAALKLVVVIGEEI